MKDLDLIKKQFTDYLNNFMDELKKSSSENNELITNLYNKDKDYMDEIQECLFEYKRDFLDDTKELDKLFSKNNIELIKGLSLSNIWNISDADNKNAISQYIKVLIFILEATDTKTETKEENKDDFEKLLKESLLNNDNNLKVFVKI